MIDATRALDGMQSVSMKSGLEGRNNGGHDRAGTPQRAVSMESGLEGRNNPKGWGSVHSTRFESQ